METIRSCIEFVAFGFEILAVVLMATLIAVGMARLAMTSRDARSFADLRLVVGRVLLLGLELLVVADVIRTVTLESTLDNLAGLAALVVIRTFLGWTLSLEIEGCWPWQGERTVATAPPENAVAVDGGR